MKEDFGRVLIAEFDASVDFATFPIMFLAMPISLITSMFVFLRLACQLRTDFSRENRGLEVGFNLGNIAVDRQSRVFSFRSEPVVGSCDRGLKKGFQAHLRLQH
jgi:hypothetical protein